MMSAVRGRVANIVGSVFDWRAARSEIASRLRYPFAGRDEALARWSHRRFHGTEADLANPRKLTEKICWLKVHDRRELLNRMCCKVEAREIVRERGYGHLLKDLYAVWERAEDIDLGALPAQFALKGTHGSQMNYFHPGGRAPDRVAIVRAARRWLNTNFASHYGEWAYRNIQPRLLAEELLLRFEPLGLPEIRVWCFAGNPRFIRWSHGFSGVKRHGEIVPVQGVFLDLDWNPMPFRNPLRVTMEPPPRPAYQREMLAAAQALSQDMPMVRIDFTDCGGRLFFGEFTVCPNAGRLPWDPPEADLEIGKMIELPDPADLR